VIGTHRFYMMEKVVHGTPAAVALKAEIERLNKTKIFVVTNRSLAGSSRLGEITESLGALCVGLYSGVTAHGPRQCVIEGAEAARATGADILVAIGGRSVIDAAKVMQLCLRHGIRESSGLKNMLADTAAILQAGRPMRIFGSEASPYRRRCPRPNSPGSAAHRIPSGV
jgi:maleylacetate reductase